MPLLPILPHLFARLEALAAHRHQGLTLIGLNPNTTYYYRIRSQDEAGNEAIYGYGIGDNACTFSTSRAETRTTEFFIVARQTALNQSDGEDTSAFTVYIPEDNYSIQSAFIEMTGVFSTDSAPPSSVTLRVNSQTSVSYSVGTDTGVVTPFAIIHEVPSANLNIATPGSSSATNTFGVTVDDSGTSVSIVSAKIVVTYYHTPVQ
jgi:hypothetical protein